MAHRAGLPRLKNPLAIELTMDLKSSPDSVKNPHPVSRRSVLAAALGLTLPAGSWAMCASPKENGRWHNVDPKIDLAYIDVKMIDCGDQVLNGEQTQTRYTMRAWVRQSSGKFYGRPSVAANYRAWKGQQWLYGRIPTGGYQDHMWLHAEEKDGQPHLHVRIKHESLDSKPSASSDFWFKR